MDVRDVTTARLRHSVLEAGDGDPLLLVHGFTGAKEDFADHVDAFAGERWHVVAPDLRGHGDSDKPADEADYSVPILAADVLALADALGWDSFHLLGHSMGGITAQELVLGAPDRVRSLVLMDTAHGPVQGIDPEMAAVALAVVRSDGIERLMELTAAADVRTPTPAEQRVRAERPGYEEFGERKMRACSPAMFAALATELLEGLDRIDALRGLEVRTLVVVGAEDEAFVGPSRRMAEAIPGAELEVVADAAHSPQFENPERWWDLVSAFLARARAEAPAGTT